MQRLRRCTVLIALCTAMAGVGCGGGDVTESVSDSGSDDASDSEADSGGGADADVDGAPGDADLDAAPPINGKPAMTLGAGGTVCKSPNFKMFVTLGQGPGGNGTGTSTNYQLRGGVVGASQAP